MELTDQQLVEQFHSSQDQSALNKLLDRHLPRIRSVVFQMVLNETDADDLTQDVFVKVIRGVESFNGRSEFSTWLHRVAMNTVYSWISRRKRRSVENQTEFPESFTGSAPTPESVAIQTELSTDVQRALGQLSPNLRAAIVLVCLQGKSATEAAEIEDCSTDTMHWRVHEARRKLKNLLREHLS